MKISRVMISATGSGSGKTLITCGILKALMNRGMKIASFKSGPDYIDPMFHTTVIGTKSKNLDTFFTDAKTTRYLFGRTAKDVDISILEGVMGYYDGLGGISPVASSYEVAKTIEAPVVLIINCKGMSYSILPLIKGFVEYERDSNIKGVILNQISQNLYENLKTQIETKLEVKVLGYVPKVNELVIESRHLGLITPDNIKDLDVRLNQLANLLEETIDLDQLIHIATEVEEFAYEPIRYERATIEEKQLKVAVAKDEAFCFYYEDNLELLRELGAEIVMFSPLKDAVLPEGVDGLLLGGGYPELYAKELSANTNMLNSLRQALKDKLPCMAECGGFMYLHKTLEDNQGAIFPMVGRIDGHAYKTNRLGRFGYIELKATKKSEFCEEEDRVKAHEFHYWDSDNCGSSYMATKPLGSRKWECIHEEEGLLAGFPHLYYYSNPKIPRRFLEKCLKHRSNRNNETSVK